jgi:hypothetical protein
MDLKFGVFGNLKYLDAGFEGASLESIQDMKRITPNLESLAILSASSETINALLETLENLKAVKIWNCLTWDLSDKVYPKIKCLEFIFAEESEDVLCVEKISKQFPNLESLIIEYESDNDVTVSDFATLLSQLKSLKTLYIRIGAECDSDPYSLLHFFEERGNKLEDAKIGVCLTGADSAYCIFEKRPGGSFFINEKFERNFRSSWMREFFF